MKLKPYPKYRDSGVPWLGDVPEHWEVKPGLSIFREKQVKNKGLIEKRVLTLSYGKIKIKPEEKLRGLVPESFDTYQIVEPGDIIIRSTDMQNDHTSLRTGLVKDKGIITSAYICLNSLNNELSNFNHWLLHGLDLMKVFYGLGSGLRQNLSWSDFKRLPLPIPPKHEQQQIARYLDWKTAQINKFIRNKRRLIQLLKEQKQNIINQAVTKGINPNVEMKDSGVEWLGQIPAHWEVRKLKTIAKVKASGVDKHSRENEIPIQLCNYTDVYKNDKITDSMDFMKATATKEEISNFELVAGDVIITKDSEIWDDIAVPAYVPNSLQNVICAYHLSLIRPRQEYIKGDFLYHCFLAPSLAYQFKVTATGVTRFGLSQGTIKSALFPVPPNSEQQEIIAYIEKETALIDKTIARTEREIELIQEYRTRLVSDVVTGKLDVRGIEIPDFEPVEADLELEEDDESEGEEIDEDE